MLTPNSSQSSYLPASEFLKRYDSRLVSELVSDTGVAVLAADLPTNLNLLAALLDASGMLEAAVLVGGRYSPSDLEALVQPIPMSSPPLYTTGGSFVFRLVADLAYNMLRERRGMVEDNPTAAYKEAMLLLKSLAEGSTILSFTETEAAGIANNVYLNERDFERLGLLTNQSRYWGVLLNRYRPFG